MIQRLLLKLRPQAPLSAVNATANLRPLFEQFAGSSGPMGLTSAQWFLADTPNLAPGWDTAHTREVAGALGLNGDSVLFVEPDIQNEMFRDATPQIAGNCSAAPQNSEKGAIGTGFTWQLGDDFSQLASARAAVNFTDPRVRIAHIDTGYDPSHSARPARILHDLERNFASSGSGQSPLCR